ncbi:MAG: hypothetical protein BWY69_00444 [Planctomycetes bacterium ADurb.Bin401]|nr:MAG: hypothetical protein BWY69_00444 [Planctomycetes bacterium ADurb.Bin401]
MAADVELNIIKRPKLPDRAGEFFFVAFICYDNFFSETSGEFGGINTAAKNTEAHNNYRFIFKKVILHSGNSQKEMYNINSKYEYRNPKQIRISKNHKFKTSTKIIFQAA